MHSPRRVAGDDGGCRLPRQAADGRREDRVGRNGRRRVAGADDAVEEVPHEAAHHDAAAAAAGRRHRAAADMDRLDDSIASSGQGAHAAVGGAGAAGRRHGDVDQAQVRHAAAASQSPEQSPFAAARHGHVGDRAVVAVEGGVVIAADGRPVGIGVVRVHVAVGVRVEVQVRRQLVAGAVAVVAQVRAVQTAHVLRPRRTREGGPVVRLVGARVAVAVQVPARRVQFGQRVDLDQEVAVGVVIRTAHLVVLGGCPHGRRLARVLAAVRLVDDVRPFAHRVVVVLRPNRHRPRRLPVPRRERQAARRHRDRRVGARRRHRRVAARRQRRQAHRVRPRSPFAQRQGGQLVAGRVRVRVHENAHIVVRHLRRQDRRDAVVAAAVRLVADVHLLAVRIGVVHRRQPRRLRRVPVAGGERQRVLQARRRVRVRRRRGPRRCW